MTIRERWREILGELAGSASLCWDEKPHGVFDSTQALKFIDHALDALFDALPVCKTKEEMLECMTEPSDSVDVMLRKAQKISEIIGWNACLAKIKEA